LQSIAPDPDWARNEQARVGQVLGEAMGRNAQAQSDLANAVRHLGQVRRDGAAGLADGAMRHFNAFSREQELHMMPTLRGVYRTTDPNAPPVIGANRLEPI
jgi:hypothetical protein